MDRLWDHNILITHNLFPTSVSSFELGREFNDEENKFLLNLEQKPNDGAGGSGVVILKLNA